MTDALILRNWTGPLKVNISVNTPSFKKPILSVNYYPSVTMPCGWHPVRGTLVSLSVDRFHVGQVLISWKNRGVLHWAMELFQISFRNILLANQMLVQTLNGWYMVFKCLNCSSIQGIVLHLTSAVQLMFQSF